MTSVSQVSGNYVANNGADSSAGIGTDESDFHSSWQLFYEGEAFDGNFLLSRLLPSRKRWPSLPSATMAMVNDPGGDREGYSLAAAWKPADAGFLPSVSTGYLLLDEDDSSATSDAWYVGLEWSDVFIEGNSFGGAIGSAPNTGR